jgi:peptide/nickel transport system permease protein
MLRYIAKRVLWSVFVLLLITLVTYFIYYVLPPTDATQTFTHGSATQQASRLLRISLGLDRPWYVQYGLFVKHLVVGDRYGWPGLGFSVKTRSALKPILADRMVVTAQLAIGAAFIWLLLGIPIGILSALRPRSLGDRLAMGFALFGVSAPVFWLGTMFLYVFWFRLGIASSSGYASFSTSFGSWINHMIMPWIVLALLFAAFYARMARGNLLEAMTQDFIMTARAKASRNRGWC